MRLAAGLVRVLALGGVVLAVAGGAASGLALANRMNEPGHRDLVLIDPTSATAGASSTALRSAGGFSGFDGAAALAGQAVRSGTLNAATSANGTFEVTSNGSSLAIRSTSDARLFRIARATAPLAAGNLVQVRVQADGSAAGVLRLPADLHEGGAAPTPAPSATPTGAPSGTPRP